MSNKSYSENGWGVCLSNIEFKTLEEFKKGIYTLAQKAKGTDYAQCFIEAEEKHADKIKTTEDFINLVIKDCFDYEGLATFMSDVMNDIEDLGTSAFETDEYNDSYVSVGLYYPFGAIPSQCIHTREEWAEIFNSYFSHITDEKVEPDYISAYYYG